MAYIVIQRRLCSSRKGATVYKYGIAHNSTSEVLEFDDAYNFEANVINENVLIPVKFKTMSEAQLMIMKHEAKDITYENLRALRKAAKRGYGEMNEVNMTNIIKSSSYMSPVTTYHILEENDIDEIISMQHMSESYISTIEEAGDSVAK
ncbi:MAG: hypothetical protein ACRCXT_18300 [Paraclostridium sp.]